MQNGLCSFCASRSLIVWHYPPRRAQSPACRSAQSLAVLRWASGIAPWDTKGRRWHVSLQIPALGQRPGKSEGAPCGPENRRGANESPCILNAARSGGFCPVPDPPEAPCGSPGGVLPQPKFERFQYERQIQTPSSKAAAGIHLDVHTKYCVQAGFSLVPSRYSGSGAGCFTVVLLRQTSWRIACVQTEKTHDRTV